VPIAIIGIGCLFPKADGVESYWANLQSGVDAISDVPPTHWRPEDYFDKDPKKPDHTYAMRGGFLSPVDFPALELGISPNVLEATDTSQLLGLLAARQALDSAGYGTGREFDRNRVSVILGVTGALELVVPLGARLGHPQWKKALKEAGVDDAVAGDVMKKIADSYVGWQEDSFPGLLGNVVAGRIANRLDLGGTNCVVDAACASSLSALHLALLELTAGRSDMVITGGMDTFSTIFMYMCFSKTPALSPTGEARPFDAAADGTILGEGLGCLLLKRLADAERDGDRVFAVIRSVGTSSDGKGQAIYAPSPKGQAKALRQAYRLAGVTPQTIELVEAHGTGTKAGDAAEVTALNEVYGRGTGGSSVLSRAWCALGSVKSQIGHTKAAAGVAGLIKAVLALHHKVLPPTIKVTQPIEQIASESPFYVNTEKRPWMPPLDHPRRAAVSAFGFGGSNFHCVLEEHGSRKEVIDWDPNVQILAFSADKRQDLIERLTQWPSNLAWDDMRIEAARSRARFSNKHSYRLTIVAERGKKEPAQLIAAALALLVKSAPETKWSTPDGIYFTHGTVAGKLAMIFPGQGSQYVGMLRDLSCRWPHMQNALAEANTSFAAGSSPRRLSDYIYPQSVFCDKDRQHNEDALRATDVAQPALGALSLGALHVLGYFGVRPEVTAGHSFGELTGLCAAGWIDASSLHLLSQLRGRLMAAGSGDRGGMLAVRAPLGTVEDVIREERLDLVLANRNASNQAVLSGSTMQIASAREVFARRQIDSRPLAVAAAFHSRFVEGARRPFQEALDKIDFHPTETAVFANSTAQEYPSEPSQIRRLLAGHLAEPVEFLGEIDNMYQAGVRTFLEVGPGNKLTGLVASILEGRPHDVLTVDASSGKRSGSVDLARVLAQLAALGQQADLARWDEGQAEKQTTAEKKPTLTVPICGANYVKPRELKPVELPPRKAAVKHAAKPSDPVVKAANHDSNSSVVKAASFDRDSTLASTNGASGNGTAHHVDKRPTTVSSPEVRPTSALSNPPSSPGLERSLAMTQENLLALQKLGEQTAQLHRQFLEGQDRALQVFQSLVDQQHQLLQVDGGVVSGQWSVVSNGRDSEVPSPAAAAAPQEAPVPTMAAVPTRNGSNGVPTHQDKVGGGHAAAESNGNSNGVPSHASDHSTGNRLAETTLLDVVAAKTGYPAEMLQLDMELDTDLGIDSIKRVEIFALLQERLPDAPAVKAEHLGTLRTLRQVVGFLGNGSAGHAENGSRVHENTAAANGQERKPASSQIRPPEQTNINAEHAAAVFLEVVSQKTGYPSDMLHLDMELDTDLGIDSIKRVEIFALLQEKLPEAPTVKAEHLGTLRTIQQVIDLIAAPANRNGDHPSVKAVKAGSFDNGQPQAVPNEESRIERQVLTTVDLDDATQRPKAAMAAGGDVWITGEWGELALKLARCLDLLGYRSKLVSLKEVRALAKPVILAGLVMLALPGGVNAAFFFEALQLLQLAAVGLRSSSKSGGSSFVTVSQQGGTFGVDDLPDGADPLSGGLAGLSKTARHEWPEVNCKAIDLAPNLDLDQAAQSIVEEMLLFGPAEVGLTPGRRCALQLTSAPHPTFDLRSPTSDLRPLTSDLRSPTSDLRPLTAGDVVVITGGARGVTAETAVALAETFAPALVLLGRSPPPSMEPSWLAALSHESEIKQALAAKMNGQANLRDIGERYRLLTANREVIRNIQRMEKAGARVVYRQVDVRNTDDIRAVFAEIRRELGPIRALVHGAGVLADRLIEDKTAEQFETVYATKASSLQTMLDVLRDDDIRVLALFSSSTGRFGRAGQIDYAVANEVLNKLAQREARNRPSCRVVSFNWGPWDGGMVNAGLKKVFAQEGVGVIPLREGAEFFIREICQPVGGPVEVVVGGRRPVVGDQWSVVSEDRADSVSRPTNGRSSSAAVSVAFERELTVESMPVLRSHVIKGQPVLPMALIVEWLAHGALHANPGLAFHGFNDLTVLKGVILTDGQPATLRVFTGKAIKEDGYIRIPVEMRGSLRAGREDVHARAEIVLAAKLPAPQGTPLELNAQPYPHGKSEIYGTLLFHGPELQGIEQVESCSVEGIVAAVSCAPAPSNWIRQPLRGTWLAEPLVLDSAFQMMILWSFDQYGAGSLPTSVGRYRQYRRSFPAAGVRVVARVSKKSEHRALADIDFQDGDGNVIARMTDYECVIDASLNQAFRGNQLC
jgi:acyl transferase domain-containing protein/NAD(P)-dependent dehydrogenase (short-subunit alcohol dehydrogenase family)